MAKHSTGNTSSAGKLKIHGGFKAMESEKKGMDKKSPRKK